MEQPLAEFNDFVDLVKNAAKDRFPTLSDEFLHTIKQKWSEGIIFWSDLDLEEAFRAAGFSEKQITELHKTNPIDKSRIIQTLLDELSKATLEDGLTHVYNRRFFERSLAAELDRSRRDQRPCGLILLDIDKFKDFNDTYGHDVGDLVLKTVADAIKNTLRSTDTVSRVGGEEFAIIVPNTFRLDAGFLAERIRKNVEALIIETEAEKLSVTISLGVAINDPSKFTSLDELYKRADNALYEAKESGRNCLRFSIEETEKASSAVTADERNELLG